MLRKNLKFQGLYLHTTFYPSHHQQQQQHTLTDTHIRAHTYKYTHTHARRASSCLVWPRLHAMVAHFPRLSVWPAGDCGDATVARYQLKRRGGSAEEREWAEGVGQGREEVDQGAATHLFFDGTAHVWVEETPHFAATSFFLSPLSTHSPPSHLPGYKMKSTRAFNAYLMASLLNMSSNLSRILIFRMAVH